MAVNKTQNSPVSRKMGSPRPALASLVAFISLIIFDLIALSAAIYCAYLLRENVLSFISPALFGDKLLENTFELLWWYPLAFIFSFAYEKLYHKRMPFWTEVEHIVKASTISLFITIAFIYVLGLAAVISRAMVVIIWFLSLFFIPTIRYYGKKLLLKISVWSCPVILIGDRDTVQYIASGLNREATMGYQVKGFISVGNSELSANPDGTSSCPVPCLGELRDAERIITESGIEDLFIAVRDLPNRELVQLTNRFQPLVNNLIVVPQLFGITLNGIDIAYLFEEQAILLQIKNRLKSPFSRVVKRLFDLTAGLTIFIFTLPLLALGVAAIKLDSRGPAFFIQERIGQDGKTFFVCKFRTMYTNSDQILDEYLESSPEARLEWEEYRKLRTYDPRVTRVGRLIRKYSLDELPQMINVLKGEMSLVGPRPYLLSEKKALGLYTCEILTAKPGITGLWQVSGRSNLSFESRVKLESWYVRNWSLWLDVVMLLKTVRVVLRTDGAY